MNFPSPIVCALLISGMTLEAGKLTEQDRIEILRGLTSEYATAKVFLPRSKKPLPYESTGVWDKAKWSEAAREFGPAARVGDLVQVTKVEIDDKRIVFEINGGLKSGKKWYERIQVGMGTTTRPIATGKKTPAPGGTTIALEFDKDVPVLKAADIKKLLAPILDFQKQSATEHYMETLPAPIKQAILDKKAVEGMDRDQVLLALGHPLRKIREVKDGVETEDWVYGEPPGKITFVTFTGSKVTKVKDAYAGLGGSTVQIPTSVP
jgi:hypothetical protein